MDSLNLNNNQKNLLDSVLEFVKPDKVSDFKEVVGENLKSHQDETGKDLSKDENGGIGEVVTNILPQLLTFIKPEGFAKVKGLFDQFTKK